MQKARGHACHLRDLALPQLVGYTVSGTFHFPNGDAFHHFLHSTSFTIGRQGVLALGGGPPRFLQVCLSRSTWGTHQEVRHRFRSRDFYPLRLLFPETLS